MDSNLFGSRLNQAAYEVNNKADSEYGSVTVGGMVREVFTGQSKWLLMASAIMVTSSAVSIVQANSFLADSPEKTMIENDNAKINALSRQQRNLGRAATIKSGKRNNKNDEEDFYMQLQRLATITNDEDVKDKVEEEEQEIVMETVHPGSSQDTTLQARIANIANAQSKVRLMRNIQIGVLVAGSLGLLIGLWMSYRQAGKRAKAEEILNRGY